MAVIMFEFLKQNFADVIGFTVKSSPLIFTPTFDALGENRLIRSMEWGNSFEVISGANWHIPVPGTILVSASLTLWHVSIDELRADPGSIGQEQNASVALMISATPQALVVEVVVLDLGIGVGTVDPPLPIATYSLPSIGSLPIVAAGFLYTGRIVQLCLGTRSDDDLQSGGRGHLQEMRDAKTSSDTWMLFIPASYFVESVLALLQKAISPPPSGTEVESLPQAHWRALGAGHGVVASMGLKKIDACPAIFGRVSVSVEVDVTAAFTVNTATNNIDIALNLSADASDWDSFRCFLGTGGVGSLLSSLVVPFLQWPLALASLITVGEIVRYMVDGDVSDIQIDNFQKVGGDDESYDYRGSISLSGLTSNRILTRIAPYMEADGLIAGGLTIPIPPAHAPLFNPDGGPLDGSWDPKINCALRTYDHQYELPKILIADDLKIADEVIRSLPVRIFSTSMADPPAHFSIDYPLRTQPHQVVGIRATGVQKGQTGFAVIHCSAGLRAYRLSPPADVPKVPDGQQIINEFCDTLHALTMDIEFLDLRWVEPPPGYSSGDAALRQWQVILADLPTDAKIRVTDAAGRELAGSGAVLRRHGSQAAIDVVTDENTQLRLEVRGGQGARLNSMQRWLLPVKTFALGAPIQGLRRTGSRVLARAKGGTYSINLDTLRLREETETNAAHHDRTAAESSLTLSRDRVAVVHGHLLVIAQPLAKKTLTQMR
jgi:hypothetical protein